MHWPTLTRRDIAGLAAVAATTAGAILYRQIWLEPRAWGNACAAAAPPFACLPRAGLIWLQGHYLLGTASLALGLWSFAGRGAFASQIAAILFGIIAVENYNATWGAAGAALGAWAWLRRDHWTLAHAA